MEFDPNAPFEELGPEVEFDPSAPFEAIDTESASTQPEGKSGFRKDLFDSLNRYDRMSPSEQRNAADENSGFAGALGKMAKNAWGRAGEILSYGGGLIAEKIDGIADAHDNLVGEGNSWLHMKGNGAQTRVLNGVFDHHDLVKARDNAMLDSPEQDVLNELVTKMEASGITDGVKMMDELKDSVREHLWDPTSNDRVRKLSDGTLRINPALLADADRNKGLEAIRESGASAEQIKSETKRFEEGRKATATEFDKRTREYDASYREHAKELEAAGVTDPEKIFFSWEGLDRNFIESSWDFVRDVGAETGRGLYRQGAAIVGGLAEKLNNDAILNHVTPDGITAAMGREILESSKKSDFVTGIATARGQDGPLRDPAKSMLTSVGQMAPMFVAGAGGRMITASSETAGMKMLGKAVAGGGIYGTAFGQGYGSIMETALKTADARAQAEGRQLSDQEITQTVHDFQGPAIGNGAQTMLLSKLLPQGSEAFAREGFKAVGMTGKEMLTAVRQQWGKDASVAGLIRSMRPELTAFAKEALGKTKAGFKDEAIEEGVNQYLEGMITILSDADPDKTFDQVGQEAWTGAWQGGIIGGGLSGASVVGSGFAEGFFQKAKTDAVQTGLPQTADVLDEESGLMLDARAQATLAASTPESKPEPKAGVIPITGIERGIPVAEMSGKGVAETIFGKPNQGGEYRDDISPEDFSVADKPTTGTGTILDGTRAVLYHGYKGSAPTDRAFNPATGQFIPVPLEQQEAPEATVRMMELTKPKARETPKAAEPLASRPAEEADPLDAIDVAPVNSGNTEVASTQPAEASGGQNEVPLAPATPETPETNEPNPQGQSGPEVPAAPQVPVSSLPAGPAAQPDPEPAGVVPGAAAPAQAQAQAEVGAGAETRIAELEEALKTASPSEFQDIANEIDSLRSGLGTSSPALPVTRAGDPGFSMPEQDLARHLTKGRAVRNSVEFIDSGKPSGNPGEALRIARPLPLGSVITGTDGASTVSRRVVAFTEVLDDGGVRHHLRTLEGTETEARAYEPAPGIASRSAEVAQAVASGNRDQARHGIEMVARAQFASIANNAFVAGKVDFTLEGDPMSYHRGRITVNTEALRREWDAALSRVDSPQARELLQRDLSQGVGLRAYEEMFHSVAEQELALGSEGGNDLANQMRVMLELAAAPGDLRESFLHSARYRMLSQSFSLGRQENLTDDQVLELLSGKSVAGMELASPQLDEELWAIGHEWLAAHDIALKTGRDVHAFERSIQRMASAYAAEGKNASTARLWAARITELANRVADAIRRFLGAQRLIGQLPPRLVAMHDRLSALMAEGGFKAPDIHEVKGKAINQLRDGMGHVVQANRLQDAGDYEIKASLANVISRIQSERNDPDYRPVEVNPATGRLSGRPTLKPAERALLEPLLETLNSPLRTETYLRTQAIARDLKLVLFPLNAGREVSANSKILDTVDPMRVIDRHAEIRAGLDQHLSQAAGGLSPRALVDAVNRNAPVDFSGGPLPSRDLSDYFIDGDGAADIELRALALQAREANEVFSARELELEVLDGPSIRPVNDYNERVSRVLQAEERFQNEVDRIIDSGTGMAPRLLQIRNAARKSLDESIREYNRRQADQRPYTSVQDMAERMGEGSSRLFVALTQAGLDADRVMDSLQRRLDTRDAIRRLEDYPAEIEYLVAGGPRPPSLRGEIRGWTNLNAIAPQEGLALLPIGLSRALRPAADNQPAMTREAATGLLGANTPATLAGPVPGRAGAFDPGSPESEVRQFAEGRGGEQVVFANGAIEAPRGLYARLIGNATSAITEASKSASRLFGMEPMSQVVDASGEKLGWKERDRTLFRNALAIARPLVDNLADAVMRGETPLDVERTAGFPLPLEASKEGEAVIVFPDRLIDLPEMELEADGEFISYARHAESGAVAGQLAPMIGFLETLESADDGHVPALLAHQGGLTPAGLAYQALAPKLMEFLALARGGKFNYDAAIANGSLTPEIRAVVERAFQSLAPGLERAPAFAAARAALEGSDQILSQKFWELRRAAKLANAIYRSSTGRIGSRKLARAQDEAKSGLPEARRFPLNMQRLSDNEFGSSFRRTLSRRNKHKPASGALLSLISPVKAAVFLERYSRLDSEAQLMVEKGGVIMGQGEDSRLSKGAIEIAELGDNRREWMRAEEERAAEWRERWRTDALMALFGGDRRLVQRFVSLPEFTTLVTDGPAPEFEYNTARIDQAIVAKLEELQREEIARGVVLDPRGMALDASVRMLRQRNPDHEAVLDQILASGATAMTQISEPDLRASADGASYDASAATLVSGLANRIPGITILQGRASHLLQDDAGRIPSVVFINDGEAPTLIFPYRSGMDASNAAFKPALAEMIRWFGDHGRVDLYEQARALLAPLAALSSDSGLSAHRQAFSTLLRGHLENRSGFEVDENQEALLADHARSWALMLREGMDKALAEVDGPVAQLLTPDGALDGSSTLTLARASTLLAEVLTNSAVQRLLALAQVSAPEVTTGDAASLFGNPMTTQAMPLAMNQIVADFMGSLPEDQRVIDKRGMGATSDGDEAFSINAIYDMDEIARDLGLKDRKAMSRMGLTPLFNDQMEWQNTRLLAMLDSLRSAVTPEGLLPSAPAERSLTEMEARQLMGHDPEGLSEALEGLQARSYSVPGLPAPPVTAGDLMAVSGDVARRLRERYQEVVGSLSKDPNDASYRQLVTYGTFSFGAQDFNGDVYQDQRVAKGKIAALEAFGIPFREEAGDDGQVYRKASLMADLAELEQAARATGRLRWVNTPVLDENGLKTRDAAGNLVMERKTVFAHYADEWGRETAAAQAVLDAATTTAANRHTALRNTRLAYRKLVELRQRISAAFGRKAFREAIAGNDAGSLALAEAIPLADRSWGERDDLIREIAGKIVDDFEDGVGIARGSIYGISGAGLGAGPLFANASDIFEDHVTHLLALKEQIESTWQTLAESRDAGMGRPAFRMEAVLRRHVNTFNRRVREIERRTNQLFPGEAGEMTLPVDPEAFASLASGPALREELRRPLRLLARLGDARAVREMADRQNAAQTVRALSGGILATTVRGVDLSGRSSSRETLSERAAEAIGLALSGNTTREARFSAVAKIVSREVVPARDTAKAVRSILRTRLRDELRALQEKSGAGDLVTSDVVALSEQVRELGKVDAVTASRVVLAVLNEALEGKLATDSDNLHQAMVRKIEVETQFNARRQGISASTPDGFTTVSFAGNPDDIEVVQRVLADYGRHYSKDYLQLLGASRFRGGFADSSATQRAAAELTRVGATALSVIDGVNYQVSGGLIAPADNSREIKTIMDRLGIKDTPVNRARKKAEMRYRAEPIVALTQEEFDAQIARRIQLLEDQLGSGGVLTDQEIGDRIHSLKGRKSDNAERIAALESLLGDQALFNQQAQAMAEEFPESEGEEAPQPFARIERLSREDIEAEIAHLKSRKFGSALGSSAASADPAINVLVDRLVGAVRGPAAGKGVSSRIAAALGHFDPAKAMDNNLRHQFKFLAEARRDGSFAGAGVAMTQAGSSPDLHSRIDAVLGDLLTHPPGGLPPESLAAFQKVFAEAWATARAAPILDGLMAGYMSGKVLDESFKNNLTERDAQSLIVFSRSFKGQDASNNIASIVDHGPFADTGRNGYEGQNGKLQELVHQSFRKIKGDTLEKSSWAWMANVITSSLMTNPTQDARVKARRMIRMLDQAAGGYAQALGSGGGLQAWMGESTAPLLEERKVFGELYRRFMPVLQHLDNGGDLGDAVLRINNPAPVGPRDKDYGEDANQYRKTLREVFGHVASAYRGVMAAHGHDPQRFENRPDSVPAWQSFNQEHLDTRNEATTSELLALDRSPWLTGFNRQRGTGSFDMMRVNGLSAPLSILDDMLYRMNVTPAYEVSQTLSGAAQKVEGSLKQEEGKDGVLGQMADGWFSPDSTKAKTGRAAALSAHRMVVNTIRNDLFRITPTGRIASAINQLNIIGASGALNSLSQIWRQTLFGSASYVAVEGGMSPNAGYPAQLARYLGSKMFNRMKKLASTQPGALADTYAERVDAFIERHATYIYMRGADGNLMAVKDIARMRPSGRNIPEGRITGKARPLMDALTWLPRNLYDRAVIPWAETSLDWMIAKPEKVVARVIFMHKLLKEMRREARARGLAEPTMEEVLDPDSKLEIDPFVMAKASASVSLIMGQSDPSKRSKRMQPAKTNMDAVERGIWVMFAGQSLSMAANSRAGWHMIKNGDLRTKGDGATRIATTLSQNLMFVYLKYNMMVHLAGLALASLAGWDDQRRRRWVAARFGIEEGDSPEQRRRNLEFWASKLIGGSAKPVGWDKRAGSFTQAQHDLDMKLAYGQLAVGGMQQLPAIGLVGTTPIPAGVLEVFAQEALLSGLDGKVPKYKRAGIIVDDGPGRGDAGDTAVYNLSRFYLDYVGGRSTMLIGLTEMIEPFILMSQAPGEGTTAGQKARLIAAGLPFIPRELSRDIQDRAVEEAGIRKWHGQWTR